MVPEREAKSVSVEGTYETDLTERRLLEGLLTRQAGEVAARLRKAGMSGRTVTIKVRLHDFTTVNRSTTLASPTDQAAMIGRMARALLGELIATTDLSGGVRLLGVGVSGLADWVQEDLFGETGEDGGAEEAELAALADVEVPRHSRGTWSPGMDVVHAEMGRGWVWGSGRGVVTVRFETAETTPARCAPTPSTTPRSAPGPRRPRRRRARTTPRCEREPHPLAGTQLRALPQVVGVHHPEDRVAAGGRVVGEEHHRPPVRGHLHRAEHHPLARQLLVPHPRQRRAVETQSHPVGRRQHDVRRRGEALQRLGGEPVVAGPGTQPQRSRPRRPRGVVGSGRPRRYAERQPRPVADLRRADPGQDVGGARAEHRRRSQPAGDREVGAHPGGRRLQAQPRPRRQPGRRGPARGRRRRRAAARGHR